MVTWTVHIQGLENLTRTCPIITYEMEEATVPKMGFFMRVCFKEPELKMMIAGDTWPLKGVSVFRYNSF